MVWARHEPRGTHGRGARRDTSDVSAKVLRRSAMPLGAPVSSWFGDPLQYRGAVDLLVDGYAPVSISTPSSRFVRAEVVDASGTVVG